MKLLAGLLLLAGVLLVERGLHKPRRSATLDEMAAYVRSKFPPMRAGWFENHRDGGGV